MNIDTPTVLIALLIGYSMLVLDLGLARRSLLVQQPALRDWARGSLLILLGLTALPARVWIPFWLGAVITNILMTWGLTLYSRAVWRFVLDRPLPRVLWCLLPLGGVAVAVAALSGLHRAWLVSISSVGLAMQMLPMVCVLLWSSRRREPSLRTVGATLLACSVALLARAAHAQINPGDYEGLVQPGWLQGLLLLTGFVCSIGAGFGFLLACFERSVHQMERLATRDGLTGCVNRVTAHTMLSHVLEQCRRERTPMALVLLDLDHFKQVNDQHGHLVGDQVLQHFAEAVRARLRASDVFGRMGGEEFCLGLPLTGHSGAREVVEAVRSAVEAMPLVGRDGAALQVTVSAGVAVADLQSSEGEGLTIERLYGQADDLLYRAKRLGRNQVMTT